MIDDPITFLMAAALAYFILKWAIQFWTSDDDRVDIQVVFPVELRYNEHQWYGWDHDGEFLGQAPTKDALMELLSEEIDLPIDKFKIMSEQKILQPAK